jgi:hypothetical protein
MAELSKYEQKAVDESKAKMASFKANFEDLQRFVKDVILANFKEFELSVHATQCWLLPLAACRRCCDSC